MNQLLSSPLCPHQLDKLQHQNHSDMKTLDIRMQQMMGMFQMFMMNQSLGMAPNLNGAVKSMPNPVNPHTVPMQSSQSVQFPMKSRDQRSSDSGSSDDSNSGSGSGSKRKHKHRKHRSQKEKRSSKKHRHKDRKHRDKDRDRKRDREKSGVELDAVPIFNDNDLSENRGYIPSAYSPYISPSIFPANLRSTAIIPGIHSLSL